MFHFKPFPWTLHGLIFPWEGPSSDFFPNIPPVSMPRIIPRDRSYNMTKDSIPPPLPRKDGGGGCSGTWI